MQEISELKQKQREAKVELEVFQKKDKKSRYYFNKKRRSVIMDARIPIDSSGDLSNQTSNQTSSSDSGNPPAIPVDDLSCSPIASNYEQVPTETGLTSAEKEPFLECPLALTM